MTATTLLAVGANLTALSLSLKAMQLAASTAFPALTTGALGAGTAVGGLLTVLRAALGPIAALWAAFEGGMYIGEKLRSNFAGIERAGIALAAGLTKAAAMAQAAWEMMKAPFNDDTWEAAQERLRVNFEDGRAVQVRTDKLQDKRHRPFFFETMTLHPGQVYYSRLDLNIENDQIELPYKPTLRVATPLYDSKGNARGILTLNFLAKVLLERLGQMPSSFGLELHLVDHEGYWLLSPDPQQAWGFMLGQRAAQIRHHRTRTTHKLAKACGVAAQYPPNQPKNHQRRDGIPSEEVLL